MATKVAAPGMGAPSRSAAKAHTTRPTARMVNRTAMTAKTVTSPAPARSPWAATGGSSSSSGKAARRLTILLSAKPPMQQQQQGRQPQRSRGNLELRLVEHEIAVTIEQELLDLRFRTPFLASSDESPDGDRLPVAHWNQQWSGSGRRGNEPRASAAQTSPAARDRLAGDRCRGAGRPAGSSTSASIGKSQALDAHSLPCPAGCDSGQELFPPDFESHGRDVLVEHGAVGPDQEGLGRTVDAPVDSRPAILINADGNVGITQRPQPLAWPAAESSFQLMPKIGIPRPAPMPEASRAPAGNRRTRCPRHLPGWSCPAGRCGSE